MAMTEEEQKIFDATGADVPLQMSILSQFMWKGITPHSMYLEGESIYKGLGLSQDEMETQFKIDLIKQSGCSCKKSKSKPLPTIKPTEAVQMTNSNYTAAEEASYTQHKRIFDGLGLSKAEAMAAIRN
jgi:hypothetical protein